MSELIQTSIVKLNEIVTMAWFIFMYLGCIWLVLGALSSYQFQEQINTEKNLKQGISVPAVVQSLQKVVNYDELIKEAKEYLDYDEEKFEKIEDSILEKQNDLTRLQNLIDEQKYEILLGIRRIADLEGIDIESEFSDSEASREKQIDHVIVNANLDEDHYLSKLNRQYHLNIEKAQDHASEIALLEAHKLNEGAEIEEYKEKLKNLKNLRNAVVAGSGENIEGMSDYIIDLLYMRSLKFDILATMPMQLLTLIVALSMGALGSIIYLTREFFANQQRRPFAWYFFRPLLGMVTAIAIFVLTKAGQTIISDTSGQMTSHVNPFFISFIAVISGLMSEQAFERIQATGTEFFKIEKKQILRWGHMLKAEMEKQGKSAADLAYYVGAAQEEVMGWLNESNQIPETKQKIIAAYLHKPGRYLFTDQEPLIKTCNECKKPMDNTSREREAK